MLDEKLNETLLLRTNYQLFARLKCEHTASEAPPPLVFNKEEPTKLGIRASFTESNDAKTVVDPKKVSAALEAGWLAAFEKTVRGGNNPEMEAALDPRGSVESRGK